MRATDDLYLFGNNSMLLDNSPLTWNRNLIPISDHPEWRRSKPAGLLRFAFSKSARTPRRAEPTAPLRRRSGGDAIKPDRISPGVCVAESDGVTGQSSNNKVCPTKKI